jgi:hypothetical protein
MMLRKIIALLASLLLCWAAQAAPVTWDFTGHVVHVENNDIPLDTPLEIFLRFDTEAAFLNQNVAGRYAYASNSISMEIWLNGSFVHTFYFDPGYGGTLFVRNDSPFSDPVFGDHPVDGLTFGLREDDGDGGVLSVSMIMRGTDTSVLGSGQIPTLPPPGILDLATHNFQVCASNGNNPNSCDRFELDATLDSVRFVAEPATIMLFGIAMLGLAGLGRRRRRVRV